MSEDESLEPIVAFPSETLLAQLETAERERDAALAESFQKTAIINVLTADRNRRVLRELEFLAERQRRVNVSYWIYRGWLIAGAVARFPLGGKWLAQKACEFAMGIVWKQILNEGAKEYGKRRKQTAEGPQVSGV